MIGNLKRILYFPIASYFRFFATIRLRLWHPKVIVVTGSNGKTTLLHLLESQIREKAKYSHHANSAYGIPFDILDLHRKSLQNSEWISLFLSAPFKIFSKFPQEKIYVVEADADRPDEGKFLASFLRPEIALWVSTARTHTMNFDHLVVQKKFASVDEAIAYEYGYFLEYCTELAVINGDSQLQLKQQTRTQRDLIAITRDEYLEKYEVLNNGTMFKIAGIIYQFSYLLPEEIFYSLAMCKEVVEHLGLSFDPSFQKFVIPPGRGSFFAGIKDTVLIDSSYNANLGSVTALLDMFEAFPVKKKWVVISDMLELGKEDKEEHEKLAELLEKMSLQKIILVGPRTGKYTFTKLKRSDDIVSFQSSAEVKKYLIENISGGESILFKGSQSMLLEGVIESLLQNPSDADKLPRRGEYWNKKRKQAGL